MAAVACGAETATSAAAPAQPSDRIICVYSHERPRCELLPLTADQIALGAANFGAVDVDHFRVRVLPVLGIPPGVL